ncbi:DUF6966 domain-containing protein [Pseudescherichia vulneris]
MMTEIKNLLNSISILLDATNEKKWAEQFKHFHQQLDADYDTTLNEIKIVFGGAGSFNDLILQKNGQMLREENIALNKLQDALYDALKKEIIARRK